MVYMYLVVHYNTNGKKITKQAFTNFKNGSTLSSKENYEFYQLRPPYIGRGVPIEYMYYM